MRPIRLEIENFTAYKGRHIIDFSPLNFFVIKGKTGAGKSSLIDAICYALYGKVPRYGSRKAHEHLLSKGQKQMFVALDFSVRGKLYRIERQYILSKRGGMTDSRFYEGGVRKSFRERELEDIIEGLIRLDYETFIKVILLPQNQFDRFLRPEDRSRRREILNSLLGFSEVLSSVKELIKEEHNRLQARLNSIKSLLEDLSHITRESLSQVESQIEQIEKEYEGLFNEKSKLEEILKSCLERDRIREELQSTIEGLERLKEKEGKIIEKKEKLELALELQPYKQKIEEYERIEGEEREYGERKRRKELEIKKYEDEEKAVREEFERIKKDFERLEEYNTERLELSKMVQKVDESLRILKDLAKIQDKLKEVDEELGDQGEKLKDYKSRLEKGKQLTEEVQEKIRVYEEKGIEEKIKQIEKLKEQIGRLENLARDIENTEREIKELKRKQKEKEKALIGKNVEYEEAKKERENLERDIQRIREELQEESGILLREGELKELLRRIEELEINEDEKRKIEGEIGIIERKIKELDEKLSELENKRLEIYAHELRSKLKDGDVCPVCGGIVKSLDNLTYEGDIEAVLNQLREVQENKLRLERDLYNHLGKLKLFEERERNLKEELKGYTRESIQAELQSIREKLDYFADLKKKLHEKEKLFEHKRREEERWAKEIQDIKIEEAQIFEQIRARENYLERQKKEKEAITLSLPENCEEYIEEVEREYQEYRDLREKERKYQKRLEELRDELSQIENKLTQLRERKENLNLQEKEKLEKLRELEEEIILRLREKPSETLKQRLDKRIKELEEKVKHLQSEYEKIREYLSNIERRKESLISDLRNIEEHLERLKSRKREISKELFPLFERFGDLERVKEYALDQEAIKILQREIEEYNKEKYSLEEKKREMEEKINLYINLPEAEEIRKAHQEVEEKIHKNRELFGKLRQEENQIKEKLREKEKLSREYEELSYEFGLYERLKRDFTDNKFPDYISQLTLRMLIERANYYLFKFTSGQFTFELSEDDLHIMDHNVEHIRSVYSLSGGETFLASLSLAFAVADLLSKDAPIESLFIDEGFGSLDRETRESLGEFFHLIKENTNRMVGIITHVEDIAEKFEQRIEVEKKGGKASIKVIY